MQKFKFNKRQINIYFLWIFWWKSALRAESDFDIVIEFNSVRFKIRKLAKINKIYRIFSKFSWLFKRMPYIPMKNYLKIFFI